MCGDDGALKRPSLGVDIIEMLQLKQVLRCGGCGTDEMCQQGAIFLLPGSLVEYLAAQALHVAHIGVADIENEEAASSQMRADSGKRLLLLPPRTEMRE